MRALLLTLLLLGVGCGKKADDINSKNAKGDSSAKGSKDPSANEKLFYAIKKSEASFAIKALLEDGANPNAYMEDGETPLTYTLKFTREVEKAAMLRAILIGNADLNKKNREGQSPLHIAIETGNTDDLDFLVANGADINVKNTNCKSVLITALELGKELIALDLIKNGANLKKEGALAFQIADAKGLDTAASLLSDIIETADKLDQKSALTHVVEGNRHLLEYLLKQRELKKLLNGRNALAAAMEIESGYNRNKVVKLLLNHGFSPDGESADQTPPLVAAAKLNRLLAANSLLLYGADPNLLDQENKSPLSYAVKNLSVGMVSKLYFFGGQPIFSYEAEGATVFEDTCSELPQFGWMPWNRPDQETKSKKNKIAKILNCYN